MNCHCRLFDQVNLVGYPTDAIFCLGLHLKHRRSQLFVSTMRYWMLLVDSTGRDFHCCWLSHRRLPRRRPGSSQANDVITSHPSALSTHHPSTARSRETPFCKYGTEYREEKDKSIASIASHIARLYSTRSTYQITARTSLHPSPSLDMIRLH